MLTGLGNAPSSFQAEGQDLTNRLNSANTSAVNTLAAKEGGVANPALVTRDLLSSNAQTGMQTAEGIQAQEAGQTISAEAAPLGALSSLIGGASNTTSGTTTGTQSTTQNVVNQIMQLISGSSSGTTSSNPGGLAQVGDLLGLIFG